MKKYFNKNECMYKIKQFIINNNILIITILVCSIGIIIGWRSYWHIHQNNKLKNNMQMFEKIIHNMQSKSEKSLLEGEIFANQMQNVFSSIINIELAKYAVEKSNFLKAEKKLLNALKTTKQDEIKNLINIRLSRIQLTLNKTNQALITINKVNNKNWNAIKEEIKGDIFLKQGNNVEARKSYLKGIKISESDIMKTILKTKMNNIIY